MSQITKYVTVIWKQAQAQKQCLAETEDVFFQVLKKC